MQTNNASTLEVNELVACLRRHENDSFEKLYNIYAPAVYGWVIEQVKDATTAEKVLAATFLSVWQNIHLYDGSKCRLLIWIIQLSNKTMLDQYKEKKPLLKAINLINLWQPEFTW